MRIGIIILGILLCLVRVNAQTIHTIAGNGQPGYTGDGGLASDATIGFPGLLAFDRFGNLYISSLNNTVRKVDPNGIITKVAGNGTPGYSGDGGLAVNAQFDFTGGGGMTLDSLGNLFIADQANNRIRKIDVVTGIVTTIAGTGQAGFSGDGGVSLSAIFDSPTSLDFDKDGNLYILDGFNYRIRKIDATGIIATIAGNGTMGTNGDGGSAINAQITTAGVISIGPTNNLIIAEGLTVRKIDLSTGIITTIAGTGIGGYNGDGISAISANMATVLCAVTDQFGNVYISDGGNIRIRKVDVGGIIHTVAGTGVSGYNGDDIPAITAEFSSPRGIILDTCGNLYVADNGNYRIRKVDFNPNCWPVSVQEHTPTSFNLYPNPASTDLTITGNHLQNISITNTLGQIVHWQKVTSEKTVVDILSLNAGIYFVTVTDVQGAKVTKKVMKE